VRVYKAGQSRGNRSPTGDKQAPQDSPQVTFNIPKMLFKLPKLSSGESSHVQRPI